MGYLLNIGISVDQLGNALTGGDPDNTISARVGYHNHQKNTPFQWVILRYIIDITFYPVDGWGHCHQAYHSDPSEDFTKGSNIALAFLFILILANCIIISIILYFLWLIGIARPDSKSKKYDELIKKRIHSSYKKLGSVTQELTETNQKKYEEVIQHLQEAQQALKNAKEKMPEKN